MSVYSKIFDENVLFNTIFINVKAVPEYKDIFEFEANNPSFYEEWVKFITNKGISNSNENYFKYASYMPEFSKIVAISYCTVYSGVEGLKRTLETINNENELTLIDSFFNYLNEKFIDGYNSNPKIVHNLSGHNVLSYDIKFLIKRFIYLSKINGVDVSNIKLPNLIKLAISAKPWESNVIDTMETNNFGGYDNNSLSLVSGFFNLKKKIKLKDNHDLALEYWNSGCDLSEINLQSKNIVNLGLQYINLIRGL